MRHRILILILLLVITCIIYYIFWTRFQHFMDSPSIPPAEIKVEPKFPIPSKISTIEQEVLTVTHDGGSISITTENTPTNIENINKLGFLNNVSKIWVAKGYKLTLFKVQDFGKEGSVELAANLQEDKTLTSLASFSQATTIPTLFTMQDVKSVRVDAAGSSYSTGSANDPSVVPTNQGSLKPIIYAGAGNEINAHNPNPNDLSKFTYTVPWWRDSFLMKDSVTYTLIFTIKVETVCPKWRSVLFFGNDDSWGQLPNGNWITDRSPGLWIYPYPYPYEPTKPLPDKTYLHFRQVSYVDGNDGIDIEMPINQWVHVAIVVNNTIAKIYRYTSDEINDNTVLAPVASLVRDQKFRWGYTKSKKMIVNIPYLREPTVNGVLGNIKDQYNWPGIKLYDVYFEDKELTEQTIKALFLNSKKQDKPGPINQASASTYDSVNIRPKITTAAGNTQTTDMLMNMSIDCKNNNNKDGVLSRMQLRPVMEKGVQKFDGNNRQMFAYEYECLPTNHENIDDNAYYVSLATPANEYGEGQTIYLDRHAIDCKSKNAAISSINLTKNAAGQISYNYTCLGSKARMDCSDHITDGVDDGLNYSGRWCDPAYLQQLGVGCSNGKALSYLHLRRELANNALTNKYIYAYKCCKPVG